MKAFLFLLLVSFGAFSGPKVELGLGTAEPILIAKPTILKFQSPKNASPDERARLFAIYRESYLNTEGIQAIRLQLPQSDWKRFSECVGSAIEKVSSGQWPAEAAGHLCAATNSPRLDGLNYAIYPSGKNGYAVTITGGKTRTKKAIEPVVDLLSDSQFFKNTCREIDSYGVGLISLPLRATIGVMEEIDLRAGRKGTVAIPVDLIASPPLKSKVEKQISEDGLPKDLLRLVLREVPNGRSESILCLQCPSGYISNGIDDCIKGDCSLLRGCFPKECETGEMRFRGDCIKTCKNFCEGAEEDVAENLKLIDAQIIPNENSKENSGWTSEQKTGFFNLVQQIQAQTTERINLAKAKCRTEPQVNHCSEITTLSERMYFQLGDSVENRCGHGQVYFENKCQPIGCMMCNPQSVFPYRGPQVILGCTRVQTLNAVKTLQRAKWKARDFQVCQNGKCEIRPISEADVMRALQIHGVGCIRNSYSSPGSEAQSQE